MHRIVFGLQGWWSLLRDANFRICREVLFRECEVARINNHREIRPATDLVRAIDGIVKTFGKVRAERGGKMRPGRESEHSNSVWINMPLDGMRANHPLLSLRVLQRGRRGARGSV
jgi:hypothetical protein